MARGWRDACRDGRELRKRARRLGGGVRSGIRVGPRALLRPYETLGRHARGDGASRSAPFVSEALGQPVQGTVSPMGAPDEAGAGLAHADHVRGRRAALRLPPLRQGNGRPHLRRLATEQPDRVRVAGECRGRQPSAREGDRGRVVRAEPFGRQSGGARLQAQAEGRAGMCAQGDGGARRAERPREGEGRSEGGRRNRGAAVRRGDACARVRARAERTGGVASGSVGGRACDPLV